VLLDGAPLAGVQVINDYLNRANEVTDGATDANGMIDLVVTSEGLNVVGLEHTSALTDDPDVNELFLFSTLSFTLPHVE
jgi:hypothetical protein